MRAACSVLRCNFSPVCRARSSTCSSPRSNVGRKQIVATKAAIQSLGHFLKIAYFGQMLAGADTEAAPLAVLLAIPLAMIGTQLSRQVLEVISDAQFRRWTRGLIAILATIYLIEGLALRLPRSRAEPRRVHQLAPSMERPMTIQPRHAVLRADALFLLLAGSSGMAADLAASFLAIGPQHAVLAAAPLYSDRLRRGPWACDDLRLAALVRRSSALLASHRGRDPHSARNRQSGVLVHVHRGGHAARRLSHDFAALAVRITPAHSGGYDQKLVPLTRILQV